MTISFLKRGVAATGLASIAALLLMLGGCASEQSASNMTSFSSNQSKTGTPELFSIPTDQMSHVHVVTVTPSKITRTLRLPGAVAFNAFQTTPVITQVGGPVSKILVVPGEQVKEGQPMLEVSSPDFTQLVDTYLKARDTFRVADKNYDRAKDLYDHHAIAERDLLQAESDRTQAQADLNSSEQAIRILGIKNPDDLLKNTVSAQIPLLAPINGEVVERLVSPGQVIQAGQTQAFTISDMRTVWVLVNVYQSDLAFIHMGDAVAIKTDAYPQTFRGRISYASPELDPNSRTLQARIVVDNPGEQLKKDMYVTAVVTAGSIQNAIAVPDAAVLRNDENQPFVYVAAAQNQFGRRQVDIGQSENGQTQILSGLQPGERIVADGSLFIQFANSLQQ